MNGEATSATQSRSAPGVDRDLFVFALLPLLAPCDTLAAGLGMALLAGLLPLPACLTLLVLRPFIPARTRVVWLVLVSVTFATLLGLLLQSTAWGVAERLGVYATLVAYNSLVLFEMENTLLARGARQVLVRASCTGAAAAALVVVLAGLRETLVAAGLQVFAAAPGALLLVALCAAGFAALKTGRPGRVAGPGTE